MTKSIIQQNKDICFLCGKPYPTDTHHIFNGSYRNKSDEDGLIVYLHRTCHRRLHNHSRSMLTFKQRGQRVYEETIGNREEFIERYGKNYLEANDEKKDRRCR